MKSWWLIATILAAVGGLQSTTAIAEDIALSLVNPKGRIDVPTGAVARVEARATIAFRNTETNKVVEYPNPHVELCFSKDVRQRVCELTRQIVDQPLAVVVDCQTVTKPIVREPLCTQPCFNISADDIAEADALAQRIRRGTKRACASSD
jgi:preprotein translocase subunit SecD